MIDINMIHCEQEDHDGAEDPKESQVLDPLSELRDELLTGE
jgi:hypothetical protein